MRTLAASLARRVRPGGRRSGRALVGPGVVALALAVRAAGAAPCAADTVPAAGSYVLVDTWQDRPWQRRAGAYELAIDLTDTADGRHWLLDRRRLDPGSYVHAFDATGRPEAVFAVRGSPQRIDADPAGRIYTLETLAPPDGPVSCRVAAYDAGGETAFDIEHPIPSWARCFDLGAGPDDRVYVTVHPLPYVKTADGSATASRVEVFDGSGSHVDRISAEELYPVDHTAPFHVHPVLAALDVARDGRIYAGLHFPGCT